MSETAGYWVKVNLQAVTSGLTKRRGRRQDDMDAIVWLTRIQTKRNAGIKRPDRREGVFQQLPDDVDEFWCSEDPAKWLTEDEILDVQARSEPPPAEPAD